MSEHESAAAGRRRHFAAFYGEAPPPDGFGLVVGNCQAESIRVVIDSPDVPTVRTPPVHELTRGDTRRLHDLLRRASFLVAQPVRDDYHGLPLGTGQLRASLPTTARTVTITPIRFLGLHPFQAALHVAGVEETPPFVAYHDIRTLAASAGLPVAETLSAASVRAVAADSVAELRRREERTDIRVSDLFDEVSFAQMRTVNHPGNAVFLPVAERVLEALGRDAAPTDPGRPLLSAVVAPREPWVADAWGIDPRIDPRIDLRIDPGGGSPGQWLIGDQRVPDAMVRDAHLEWYAQHPEFVAGAVPRLAQQLGRWRHS